MYLDTDRSVPPAELGSMAGETDPNPAHCGIPDRFPVYRHAGLSTTSEVIYKEPSGRLEVFVSAGAGGFPGHDVLRWLVLVLLIVIILFAALPALTAHLRQPAASSPDEGPDEAENLRS